jgi:hypothetical protein
MHFESNDKTKPFPCKRTTGIILITPVGLSSIISMALNETQPERLLPDLSQAISPRYRLEIATAFSLATTVRERLSSQVRCCHYLWSRNAGMGLTPHQILLSSIHSHYYQHDSCCCGTNARIVAAV